MKRIIILLILLLAGTGLNAQYVVSDRYDLWFEDSGHEVTTRKSILCSEDYQDLWNGCYVRLIGRKIYIYNSSNSSVLYGDEINLIYNGYYRVKRSGTWYLADPEGDLVDGIYGKDILYYPWMCTIAAERRWISIRMRARTSSGMAAGASSRAATGMPATAMVTKSTAFTATRSPSWTMATGSASAVNTFLMLKLNSN